MNGSLYYKWPLGRYLLIATTIFAVLSVGLMAKNLYKTAKIVSQTVTAGELKSIPQVISHSEYEDLLRGFKEQYAPVNVHKRNIFTKPGTAQPVRPEVIVPEGKYDFNKLDERLCITKIYKRPVKLLFKGYMQLGDGTYVATINWAGKTDFKKTGDEIRGYKVIDFKKNVSEKKTVWGGTEKIDQSTITLERGGSERFVLEIGKIALEKEIYAEIFDRKEEKNYEVYIGGEILENKVLDISPVNVIIITQNNERITIIKEN